MLHPGVVDGSTANLAGPDSGDSVERHATHLKPRRHSWSDPVRFQKPDRPDIGKTERACGNGCGIVKVTQHPGGGDRAWQEFWRDGEKIEGKGTPPCEPQRVRA